jgi:hypothetical protein
VGTEADFSAAAAKYAVSGRNGRVWLGRETTETVQAKWLLEEGEEGEEEDPEEAHAVPVPGGGVDQDLAIFHLAGDV